MGGVLDLLCRRNIGGRIFTCRGEEGVNSLEPKNVQKSNRQVDALIGFGDENDLQSIKDNLTDRIQKLEYIFDMLGEMRNIARDVDEASLVYYLEMAVMETGDACDRLKFKRDGVKDY